MTAGQGVRKAAASNDRNNEAIAQWQRSLFIEVRTSDASEDTIVKQ
ncbi:MAG: hypothetical protein AAFX01_02640 [Cyanobacteria bacterium J06638_28]